MVAMNAELLVVEGCPHADAAVELLRAALTDIGLGGVEASVTVVTSQAEAEARQFAGSPTFALNGRDVFAVGDQPSSLSCRLYPGNGGLPGLPALRQALEVAAAEGGAR